MSRKKKGRRVFFCRWESCSLSCSAKSCICILFNVKEGARNKLQIPNVGQFFFFFLFLFFQNPLSDSLKRGRTDACLLAWGLGSLNVCVRVYVCVGGGGGNLHVCLCVRSTSNLPPGIPSRAHKIHVFA